MKNRRWLANTVVLLLAITVISNYAMADDWYDEEPGYYTIREEGEIYLFLWDGNYL